MRHLVAGDDHADPLAVEHLLLRPADAVSDLEEMAEQIGRSVDPVIDLLDRHDEHMTASREG